MAFVGHKNTSKDRSIKSYAASQFSNDQRLEEKLKKLSEKPRPSMKEKSEKEVMMAKAAEFVDNGIPFEMAPEELRNHHFFKVGYEVAVKKKNAMQFIQKNSGRR